jgi:hypothetical protein
MFRYLFLVATWFIGLGNGGFAFAQNQDEFRLQTLDDPDAVFNWRSVDPGLPPKCESNSLLGRFENAEISDFKTAFFVYGQSNSRSVVVAIRNSEIGQAEATLLVDVNRNHVIDANEEFKSNGEGIWKIPLGAEFVSGASEYTLRDGSIWIIVDLEGKFKIASACKMRGQIRIEDKTISVERLDRDSNGTWFDLADRVLIDCDRDGSIDSILERFASDQTIQIDSTRYRIGGDQEGKWIRLVPMAGTGKVTTLLRTNDEGAIEDLRAVLVSRSGISVVIDKLGKPFEIPVGQYTCQSLKFNVSNSSQELSSHFEKIGTQTKFFEVEADEEHGFDLIGDMKLGGTVAVESGANGSIVNVTPYLTTSTGMFLVKSSTLREAQAVDNFLDATITIGSEFNSKKQSGFT